MAFTPRTDNLDDVMAVDVNEAYGLTLTNRSGGALVLGDVAIQDTGNDNSFTTTNVEANPLVIGVVAESIANLASGVVMNGGPIAGVKCDAVAVTRGQYLITSTTLTRATSTSTWQTGVFAIALTAKGAGVGTVTAWLLGERPGGILELRVASGDPGMVLDIAGTDKFKIGTDDSYNDQLARSTGGDLSNPFDSVASTGKAAMVAAGTPWVLFEDLHPQNLLRNASFESFNAGAAVQPDRWSAEGTPTVARDAGMTGPGTPYSLKITATVAGDEGSKQTLTGLRGSTVYTVVGFYKATGGDNAKVITTGATVNLSKTGLDQAAWTRFTGTFTTDAGGTNVVLKILATLATDVVWFDNLAVFEGPVAWAFAQHLFDYRLRPHNSKGHDFATVQAAIDDLNGDGWVFVPAGTWSEALVIDENGVTLFGVGWPSIIDGGIAGHAINSSGIHFLVRDLQLKTTAAGGNVHHALYVQGDHPTAINVYISESDYYGIEQTGDYASYYHCRIATIDNVGISADGHHTDIVGCRIYNTGSYGIHLPTSGDDSVVTGCIIDTTGNDGIFIVADAENCVIDSNRITNWTNEAIDDDSGTSVIGDNDLT